MLSTRTTLFNFQNNSHVKLCVLVARHLKSKLDSTDDTFITLNKYVKERFFKFEIYLNDGCIPSFKINLGN